MQPFKSDKLHRMEHMLEYNYLRINPIKTQSPYDDLESETSFILIFVCSPELHNGQSLFFRIFRSKITPHLLQTCISLVKMVVYSSSVKL